MSFLLNSFYYSFSKNFIEKYKKNKKYFKKYDYDEDPIITIDMNFDNIKIIEDYVEFHITNKLLNTILINDDIISNSLRYVSSYKSFINDIDENDCHISNHNFSSDNYDKLFDNSFS